MGINRSRQVLFTFLLFFYIYLPMARITVVGSVCVCVCVSVKPHLTYGASVRTENAVTYLLRGRRRSKILWDFL